MRLAALAILVVLPLSAQEPSFPKPTPHHESMKAMVGTWDVTIKVAMGQGKPPLVSKGTETCRLLRGDLWLQEDFTSEFMGTPFETRRLFGYDPAKGMHVGAWVDSLATAPSHLQGTCKDGCREVTWTFDALGMKGTPVSYKNVAVQKDADHRTLTMYTKGADGTFVQGMEMEYTRRK